MGYYWYNIFASKYYWKLEKEKRNENMVNRQIKPKPKNRKSFRFRVFYFLLVFCGFDFDIGSSYWRFHFTILIFSINVSIFTSFTTWNYNFIPFKEKILYNKLLCKHGCLQSKDKEVPSDVQCCLWRIEKSALAKQNN